MDKVLMVWIEDQINHNIPLSQSLIQRKALILFNFMKAVRREEAGNISLKLAEVGPWGLRKEAISKTWKCQMKEQVLIQRT